MDGNITITKKRYFGLRMCEEKLRLLEIGGVDNWEWYGDSLNPDGEKNINQIKEDLEKEINENN